MILRTLFAATALLAACAPAPANSSEAASQPRFNTPEGAEVAILASGCFWCTEADFEKLDGVLDAVSGFTGGDVEAPSYRQVVRGGTGHVEAVRIEYDPGVISYGDLLYHYWRTVDPLDGTGQFCDRGEAYMPRIFATTDEQAALARSSSETVAARFDEPIAVRIEAAGAFWPAEDYHQDYAVKNPIRYQRYRFGCRRDQRLRELWGDEAGGLN
ncbi:MAG: peptide-methionine (S)-S-oxide reductase MsrA [Pseudomonadota bacterium]